jgi:ABC-type glycerol-3-phosphate transport system substrate-binding protein
MYWILIKTRRKGMKKKRVIIAGTVLLLMILPLLLIAGGKEKEPGEGAAVTAEGEWARHPGASVNYLFYPSPENEAIKEMLPEFEELTGIEVTLTEMPFQEVFKKRVMDAVSGAGEYDIYPLQPGTTKYFADSGYILPLDDFWSGPEDVDYDDIYPGVRRMWEYKGKHWGLPIYPNLILLYYNREMLEDAGVKVPATMKDFEQAAKDLTIDKDGDGEIDQWGSVFNLISGDWSLMLNLCLFMYMNEADWYGGQDAADDPISEGDPMYMRPMLDQPKSIEAFEYLVQLYNDQVFSPGSINFSFFDSMENFSTGQAAMYIAFMDQGPMIVGPDSMIADKVGAAPLPAWDGVRRSHTGGWGACISSKAESPEAAFTFLKYFLGNSKNQLELSKYGQTPSRISVLTDPSLQKEFVWYEASAEMLNHVKTEPTIAEWDEFTTGLEPILMDALLGKITPKEAMLKSNDLLDTILTRAGYYE